MRVLIERLTSCNCDTINPSTKWVEMDIDLDNLDLDIDDAALAEKIEAKLQEDEVEIEAINDCESGACAI